MLFSNDYTINGSEWAKVLLEDLFMMGKLGMYSLVLYGEVGIHTKTRNQTKK